LGAVPGTLGAMTALEAVKVLTGFGETLAGTLLVFDGEDMSLSKFALTRRPDCPICS
jgi:molybdopterin/thiamine biosynthesis adenylyltransferase